MSELNADLFTFTDARVCGIDCVVQVDNVYRYLVLQRRGFQEVMADSPILIPKNPVTWFEYAPGSEPACGFLVRVEKSSSQSGGERTLVVSEYVQTRAGGADLAQEYRLRLTDHGHIVRENLRFCIQSLFDGGLDQQSLNRLSVVLASLSLLNCENVELSEVGRSQTGKQILALCVRRNGPARRDELIRKEPSFTIRNGHQKDYRQGPGLFGRHHGLYWWGV